MRIHWNVLYIVKKRKSDIYWPFQVSFFKINDNTGLGEAIFPSKLWYLFDTHIYIRRMMFIILMHCEYVENLCVCKQNIYCLITSY